MDAAELDEMLRVFESAISQVKWRLRPASKRRLETDILALCTGMRPVIMVDYGGKMPELQDRLCTFVEVCQKDSSIFEKLRVMVIEDMIYLVHLIGLRELVNSSLNLEQDLFFVDLEQDPPKITTQRDNSSIVMQLKDVQKSFSLLFPCSENINCFVQCQGTGSMTTAGTSNTEVASPHCSEVINLSSCMQDSEVTVPALNGWLLGYPIIYLFGKQHIEDAIYNLSTKPLRLFKILVLRKGISGRGSHQEEELMSFSVPYELSLDENNEPWAEAFLSQMLERWERCKHIWSLLRMEVSSCYPQAIVL